MVTSRYDSIIENFGNGLYSYFSEHHFYDPNISIKALNHNINILLQKMITYQSLRFGLKNSLKGLNAILSNNKVFIVHGHDDGAKEGMARFIEKVGLQAIILHELPSAGRTIIEKIEANSDVGFAVVLYTPCDKGCAKEKTEYSYRARQNVVFEHGYPISSCYGNSIYLVSTPTGLSTNDKLQIIRSNGAPSVDVIVTGVSGTTVTVDITTESSWRCAVKKSTLATIYPTHTEGSDNVASGAYSHAEGSLSIASGDSSHAEGQNTKAFGNYSHAEGNGGSLASGASSHAEGSACTASGSNSHAEGYSTHATYMNSHAEGDSTTASNFYAHAEGYNTTASGQSSHTEGDNNTASGASSHAGGSSSTAADYALAHGFHVGALANQTVIGHYNNAGTAGSSSGTTGDAFIIGNGVSGTLGRGFRVSYAGLTYADGAYSSGGADYAEIYEWKDGNLTGEDRVGHFVTLDGENIVFADALSDYILGIVSANPSVCGDNPIDWCGKYVTDAFGRRKIVYVDMPAVTEDITVTDENGNTVIQTVTVQEAYTAKSWEVNPDYDDTQVYVPRNERKEYDYIGTHGKLVVIDDGTCNVNGYCWVSANGIATADTVHKDFRVITRIDSSHVKVVLK